MSVLQVEKLHFSYSERPFLSDITFALEEGEIAVLIGASGSGKTTLFKLIAGMMKPQKGSIAIAEGQKSIAYMTQSDLLLPWRKVLPNLTLPFELGSTPLPSSHLQSFAINLLDELDLNACADLFPSQISGGMRQRISLARTLLQQRPLVLLDEPFGSLDQLTREKMYTFLRKKLTPRQGLLMVTHDFRDALLLADRIFLLSNGTLAKEWRVSPELRGDVHASHLLVSEMRAAL